MMAREITGNIQEPLGKIYNYTRKGTLNKTRK